MIHCTNCQYEGEPKIRRASRTLWLAWVGAVIISCLFLPLFLITIPMLLWLLKKREEICPQCGWKNMTTISKPTSSIPSKTQRPLKVLNFPGLGEYCFEIVGESHYQQELEKICGGRTEDGHKKKCLASIICDNKNPYDKNAIRVEIDTMLIGHLKKEDAAAYRELLEKIGYPEIQITCPALIVGGWDRGEGDQGHFGVKLDFPLYEGLELDGAS